MDTISGNELHRRTTRELQGIRQDLQRELARMQRDKHQAHAALNAINRALARRTFRPNL